MQDAGCWDVGLGEGSLGPWVSGQEAGLISRVFGMMSSQDHRRVS